MSSSEGDIFPFFIYSLHTLIVFASDACLCAVWESVKDTAGLLQIKYQLSALF